MIEQTFGEIMTSNGTTSYNRHSPDVRPKSGVYDNDNPPPGTTTYFPFLAALLRTIVSPILRIPASNW